MRIVLEVLAEEVILTLSDLIGLSEVYPINAGYLHLVVNRRIKLVEMVTTVPALPH